MVIGASFGHEALRAIGQAFDAAWAEIAGNFGSDPQDIECLRLRLAKAMLCIANEDSRDVDVLKQTTLEQMALDYRKSGGAHKEKGASRGNGVARCTWRHLNGGKVAPACRSREGSPAGYIVNAGDWRWFRGSNELVAIEPNTGKRAYAVSE